MKKAALLLLLPVFFFYGCKKENIATSNSTCDFQKEAEANASKVTISNGLWGTIGLMEGNCMPVIGPGSTCKTCPIQREIRIYEYTLWEDAIRSNNSSSYFISFNKPLIKSTTTDTNGFFQIELNPGHYSFAIVEDGLLYAGGMDGYGGLNAFTFERGLLNLNPLVIKAVF